MPLISSSFDPPRPLRPPWVQTIAPAVARRGRAHYDRYETLPLADGDTVDLAWHAPRMPTRSAPPAPRGVVVLTHGLEGSLGSSYIVGLARACSHAGYLVLAWSMRGCGGKPNLLPSWYHSGQTEDLAAVIEYARSQHPELPLFAVGISVGGNILCKYLGERGRSGVTPVTAAVAISSPLDLRGSAEVLAHRSRRLYMEYLLRPLRARIREKARRFPDLFTTTGLDSITSFYDFDARYTAPMHGFTSVDEYWERSSGLQYLATVRSPLLLLTAKDDPFLSPSCLPEQLATTSALLWLEAPAHGGHVGFIDSLRLHSTWLERRVLAFLERW